MNTQQIEEVTADLKTVKNFAVACDVTPSYIYKLIKRIEVSAILIDGVTFINTKLTPDINRG